MSLITVRYCITCVIARKRPKPQKWALKAWYVTGMEET